jgi:hypothetical protein
MTILHVVIIMFKLVIESEETARPIINICYLQGKKTNRNNPS